MSLQPETGDLAPSQIITTLPGATLDVAGQKFDTVEAATKHILSLPPEQQYPVSQELLGTLYKVVNAREEQVCRSDVVEMCRELTYLAG